MECLSKIERAGFLNGKMESMPRKGDFFPPFDLVHYITLLFDGWDVSKKLSELEDALGQNILVVQVVGITVGPAWPGQQDFLTSTYSE